MFTQEQLIALHMGMLLGFANFKAVAVGEGWAEFSKAGVTWRFTNDTQGQRLTSSDGFSIARRGCGYFIDDRPCDRVAFWNHLKTATVTSCDCPDCQ